MWKYGTIVPDWLSDSARVSSLGDNGEITLDMVETNTGDRVIKNQNGGTLVILPKNGYLIYSKETGILGINEVQLELLYEKIKKRD